MTYPRFTGDFGEEYRLLVDAVDDLKGESMPPELRERIDLIQGRFPHPESLQFARREEQAIIEGNVRPVTYLDTNVRPARCQKLFHIGRWELPQNSQGGIIVSRHAQELFKPMGLVLWGASEETVITGLHVGTRQQLLGDLPGRAFECNKSLAELGELAKDGNLSWPGEEYILNECEVLQPGITVQLHFKGLLKDAALWGYALR